MDIIIVLAHEMDAQGKLSEESEARIQRAVAVHKANQNCPVLVSGWNYRSDTSLYLAEAQKIVLVQAGVNPSHIYTEKDAKDTVGEAFLGKKKIVDVFGWKCLCVVTSDYHVARAERIFRFIYGPEYTIAMEAVPSRDPEGRREHEEQSVAVFQQTFEGIQAGSDTAILERITTKHPYYNGVKYPPIRIDGNE
ncbi:MAG: YdcF family protein [Cytophagaceae bacterium]|jgi:uncharacterized SAM-binding protein YcdF (DUF218 family)|nr:YdcF family protein [Cytophagaceae bacterium]